MVSLTQWTLVWVDSGSWWWTGRPSVLQFMGSQRVGHDWGTELNWTTSEAPIIHVLALQSVLHIYHFLSQFFFTTSCILLQPLPFKTRWFSNISVVLFTAATLCLNAAVRTLDILIALNLYLSLYLILQHFFFYPCWPGFSWRHQRISWALNLNPDIDHS